MDPGSSNIYKIKPKTAPTVTLGEYKGNTSPCVSQYCIVSDCIDMPDLNTVC